MPPAPDSLAAYGSPFLLSAYPRIPTAITRRESDLLAELTAGRRVLEIGTGDGYSAVWMALNRAIVDSFDTDPEVIARAQMRLAEYGVLMTVALWLGDAHTACEAAGRPYFDAAFIDGDHRYEAVRFDVWTAMRLVRRPGWVIAHDYGAQFEGVTKAVDEMLGHLAERRREGTMYATRLP